MTIDLEAIEARANLATPGPWRAKPHDFDDWGVIRAPTGKHVARAHEGLGYYPGYDERLEAHRRAGTDPTQHNMDFIACAREDIPALIAEVRRLRALKLPASQQVHNLTKELYEDAGAEIRELRSDIERKDAALRPFAKASERFTEALGYGDKAFLLAKVTVRDLRNAVAALGDGK